MGEALMDEPFTPLVEAAMGLRELFESYQEAGFTEGQSMALCVGVLTAMIGRPNADAD
jgi:hypothetical protein